MLGSKGRCISQVQDNMLAGVMQAYSQRACSCDAVACECMGMHQVSSLHTVTPQGPECGMGSSHCTTWLHVSGDVPAVDCAALPDEDVVKLGGTSGQCPNKTRVCSNRSNPKACSAKPFKNGQMWLTAHTPPESERSRPLLVGSLPRGTRSTAGLKSDPDGPVRSPTPTPRPQFTCASALDE